MERPDVFEGFAGAALDLLLPPTCPGCGDRRLERDGFCRDCAARLGPTSPHACPRCAAPLGPGALPESCDGCPVPWVSATVASGRYAGLLGELVRRVKYGGDEVLVPALSRRLRHRLRDWRADPPDVARDAPELVVPVPESRRIPGRRRIHLARRLAVAAASELGVPLRIAALRRVGRPPPQASLSRTRRRDAPRGTVDRRLPWATPWRVREFRGRVVLLVDDVLTTGATARECAKVLRHAGAHAVHVAVLARA